MAKYRLCTLYSGSTGNATFIEACGVSILIDAGKNAKALKSALNKIGSDISKIQAIFITHEHTDHISALEIISKHYEIPIHIMDRSAERFDRDKNAFIHKNLIRHADKIDVEIGGIHVSSFQTPHDSRMSVGYRIDFEDGDGFHSLAVATDIGYITEVIREALTGCEAIVLESNHDSEMLKNGPYPQELKLRIASKRGHLSNKDSATFGAELASKGTRGFILAHLSEKNNTPQLAYDEFFSAIADDRVQILVASPDEPCELNLFEKEMESYDFC